MRKFQSEIDLNPISESISNFTIFRTRNFNVFRFEKKIIQNFFKMISKKFPIQCIFHGIFCELQRFSSFFWVQKLSFHKLSLPGISCLCHNSKYAIRFSVLLSMLCHFVHPFKPFNMFHCLYYSI